MAQSVASFFMRLLMAWKLISDALFYVSDAVIAVTRCRPLISASMIRVLIITVSRNLLLLF